MQIENFGYFCLSIQRSASVRPSTILHFKSFDRECRTCREASQFYTEYRRVSTAFFMELVSVHSFSSAASRPPEERLVHMLMELVVQRKLPLLDCLSTRPFSPFEVDTIDPRPVVRSFLLQLLLKYR